MPNILNIVDNFLPYPFVESYCMFFIYSFLGWILEVIYYGVTEERFINRGFLSGPLVLCAAFGQLLHHILRNGGHLYGR